MPPSDNQLHYFISYAIAFLVLGLIAKWYLWPAIVHIRGGKGRRARLGRFEQTVRRTA